MAAAVPLAGAGISAYGDIQQGKMVSAALNQQADNLVQQAQESEEKGRFDATRQQIMAGQKIGTSIAAYGASGVAANSGSVLDVLHASHQNSELDRLNILHGADIRAINYMNQASMNRYGGASAVMGSYWKALGAATLGLVHSGAEGLGTGASNGGEGAGLDGASTYAGADSGASVAAVG